MSKENRIAILMVVVLFVSVTAVSILARHEFEQNRRLTEIERQLKSRPQLQIRCAPGDRFCEEATGQRPGK